MRGGRQSPSSRMPARLDMAFYPLDSSRARTPHPDLRQRVFLELTSPTWQVGEEDRRGDRVVPTTITGPYSIFRPRPGPSTSATPSLSRFRTCRHRAGLVQPSEAVGVYRERCGRALPCSDPCHLSDSFPSCPQDRLRLSFDDRPQIPARPRGTGFLYAKRATPAVKIEPIFLDKSRHAAKWTDDNAYTHARRRRCRFETGSAIRAAFAAASLKVPPPTRPITIFVHGVDLGAGCAIWRAPAGGLLDLEWRHSR